MYAYTPSKILIGGITAAKITQGKLELQQITTISYECYLITKNMKNKVLMKILPYLFSNIINHQFFSMEMNLNTGSFFTNKIYTIDSGNRELHNEMSIDSRGLSILEL